MNRDYLIFDIRRTRRNRRVLIFSIVVRKFGDPVPEQIEKTTTRDLTGVIAQMASVPNPRR